MGKLKVVWSVRSRERFLEIAEWNEANLGRKAAKKFTYGIRHTVDLLSQFPRMGMTYHAKVKESDTLYFRMVVHSRYAVFYTFNESTLYVATIACLTMNDATGSLH